MKNPEEILERFRDLLKANQEFEASELISSLRPYDQAELIELLSPEERLVALSLCDDSVVAEIFGELSSDIVAEIIEVMAIQKVSSILNEMASDDAVDILGDLDDEYVEKLLALMETEDAEDVRELLGYPENTAGGLMTNEFISIRGDWTVEKTLQKLRELAPEAETIYYLYVTDIMGRLAGVVSIRNLLISEPGRRIKDIMVRDVVSVTVDVDQEEAARLFEKYDFLAIPVVKSVKGKLEGIITVDDIIDVLESEATEDFSRLAAITHTSDVESLRVPPHKAASKRLPWLILLMGVGFMAGNIIAFFESTLEAVVVLAVFIPLIAGMAGNTGTQSLAIVVRGLAIGEFKARDLLWLIKRECAVGFIIGTVNGVLIALVAWAWQGNLWLGFIIGFSLWVTLIFATMIGALVPMVLHKFDIDPAVASGPFITTVNDVVGLTVYFTIATAFMSYLV